MISFAFWATVINYLDRNILNILLPAIKAEFRLTDADLGFLSGTVFAILYATLGMPLAWLADRANRRNVIAYSMMLFSLMTVFSGYAASFGQLVAARIGTGVGEAGTSPSVNSVISDLYAPKERAGALSFYAAGLNVGLLIAFAGGGWVEQHFGWRTHSWQRASPASSLGCSSSLPFPNRLAATSNSSMTPVGRIRWANRFATCGNSAPSDSSRSEPH